MKHFTASGLFTFRTSTTFLSYTKDTNTGAITSLVRDEITNEEFEIKSKYLYGCDGGRSQVIRQLNIPLIKQPGQGLAINVLVEADLSRVMESRKGNLHMVMQPDREHPEWGWWAVVRMVKPWNQYVITFSLYGTLTI